MQEDSEYILSRTSKKISLQDPTPKINVTSQHSEDGPSSTRSTLETNKMQCTGTKDNSNSTIFDREPMFVIVDSSSVSNPSSKEMLINKRSPTTETVKRNLKNMVIRLDMPCTSKDTEFMPLYNCESREELQMIDINLQSDNDISIDERIVENEPESIVTSYLRNTDIVLDKEELIVMTRRKSSLLVNVPKMETILENEQTASFSDHLMNGSLIQDADDDSKLSEHSLDVYIPSYPGSPRSINLGSGHSIDDHQDPYLREAIEFLHQDKELLVAAEIGNDKLLDTCIRRGTDIQQVDHLGRNALHFAVVAGNLRAIKLLLDAGINPNIKDNVGMTPLSLCLMRRPSLIVANLLFDHGAQLLSRTNPMDTGLFIQFAMMCKPTSEEESILRLLVQKGAVINDCNAPGGRQALHFAAMSNNTTLIRVLVNLGADVNMTNHRKETPKDTADTFKCKEAFELLSQLEETEEYSIPSSSEVH